MFDITLSDDLTVNIDGTSEGTQTKFYDKGYWYKTDTFEEGVVEYLVSKLLTFSTLPKKSYVVYEYGKINGKSGCRSKDFLKPGYELITFERIHQRITGTKLSAKKFEFETMESYIEYTVDFFRKYLDLDIKKYLKNIFTLDFITLNEDRHFNNLAVISDTKNNKYLTAPIFDNGKSLLNGNRSYRPAFSIEENIKKVIALPFSGSHKKMFDYFGKGFSIDIDSALEWLNTEPQSLYRDVLIYQLSVNKIWSKM